MRRIVNQTKTPDYDANGRLKGYTIVTDTVEDRTTPPPALRTAAAQPCAGCHQAQTACRCHVQQPRQTVIDEAGWEVLTILGQQARQTQTPSRPTAAEQDYMPLSILSRRQP